VSHPTPATSKKQLPGDRSWGLFWVSGLLLVTSGLVTRAERLSSRAAALEGGRLRRMQSGPAGQKNAAQISARAFVSNSWVWSGVWASTVRRSKTLLYSSVSDRLSR
jgi:hypothetical protein